jgi:hypothetical protein
MYEDPIGDMCQRILIVAYCLLMMIALSVYYACTTIRFKLMFASLAFQRAYNEVYFFLLKKWNYLYWKHIHTHLYICGLVPAITDKDIADSCERLRLKVADTQYDSHPGMQEWKAETRALLDTYDKQS